MKSLLSTALTLVSLALGSNAIPQSLNISNALIQPDSFVRSAVLANGTFPGPLLAGFKGDSFEINVMNNLFDKSMLTDTSIHWHGLFMRGQNWADGPAFVTQCPIKSGQSFLYDVSVPNQAGTFWYHSHLSTQYCDGLRGPLVIYDPNDPLKSLYDFDNASTIMTIADWYHIPAMDENLDDAIFADSTLINGLGRWNNSGVVIPSPLSVISVQAGKRYRIRLLNIACSPNYSFTIDGHAMTIIEADGVETKPWTVDQLTIFAGQRYSFILNANQPIGNYWIRANPNEGNVGFGGGMNSAILRYIGAPNTEPTTLPEPVRFPLQEWDLHPLIPSLPPTPVNKAINLVMTFNETDDRFYMNGYKFSPPPLPVLLQILKGQQDPAKLLPAGSVYGIPGRGTTIELTLPAEVLIGNHPFHLHGHNFYVIRSAGSSVANNIDPVIRDVVNTGVKGDNVTIRFMADNPGPWFLHCHIDWHLETGMAVVLAEDIPDTTSLGVPPPQWSSLCGA